MLRKIMLKKRAIMYIPQAHPHLPSVSKKNLMTTIGTAKLKINARRSNSISGII